MFKDKLRYLREYQKMSQAEVCERLNITQATYSRYESGVHLPGMEVLKKMSELFDVSIDYLVDNSRSDINDIVDFNDFILNGKYTINSKFPTNHEREMINTVIKAIFKEKEKIR